MRISRPQSIFCTPPFPSNKLPFPDLLVLSPCICQSFLKCRKMSGPSCFHLCIRQCHCTFDFVLLDDLIHGIVLQFLAAWQNIGICMISLPFGVLPMNFEVEVIQVSKAFNGGDLPTCVCAELFVNPGAQILFTSSRILLVSSDLNFSALVAALVLIHPSISSGQVGRDRAPHSSQPVFSNSKCST